jgi:hypothetical protein
VWKFVVFKIIYKVREMMRRMNPMAQHSSIASVKEAIMRDYADDFVGAIDYALDRITDIYSDEIQRKNKIGTGGKRQVAETTSQRGGGNSAGRGRMRYDRGGPGRGHCFRGGNGNRRGGGSGRWNANAINFSGVDVSNPTRDFSAAEWDRMGQAGRAYVNRERQNLHGRGRGRNYGGGYQARGRGRTIQEVVIPTNNGNETAAIENMTIASRGGRSGAGFGRGAHRG